jgi:CubicO group peptidase (beta-lactamase class C family)
MRARPPILRTTVLSLAAAALSAACGPRSVPDELDAYLSAYERHADFSGTALVARDGEVLFAKGYGLANREHGIPCTVDTKYRIASLTKAFCAAALLLQEERGLLARTDTVRHHARRAPEHWGDMTLHHLMSHQSGLFSLSDDAEYPVWRVLPERPLTLLKRLYDRPLLFEPGAEFDYCDSNYGVLAAVLEMTTGSRWEKLMRVDVLDPLGLENTGHDSYNTVLPGRASGYARTPEDEVIHAPHHAMEIPIGGGDFYSTVGDLLRWEQSLYGDELLSDASREALFTPNLSNYGYGWRIGEQHGRRRIAHGGGINGFNSQLSRFPDERVTVIVLVNNEWCHASRIARDLAAIAFGEPYRPPGGG